MVIHSKLGDSELSQINKCNYLGGTICTDTFIVQRVGTDGEVALNLSSISDAKEISKETKVFMYRSLAESILLYTVSQKNVQKEAKIMQSALIFHLT